MRLGVFGGSFDPVHYGHLLLAECCREQAELDELWFVPAGQPPHKLDRPISPGAGRIEMLQLAIAGQAAMRVSTLEVDRQGISYTVDTLAAIQELKPEAELFLLMGADSLADLPTWREPARICELATPLVVRRAGTGEPDWSGLASLVGPERVELIRGHRVEMPQMGLSSTDLRERARTGRSLRYRTPRAVEQYILSQRVYHDS